MHERKQEDSGRLEGQHPLRRSKSIGRALRIGCFGLLILPCFGAFLLGSALQSGPVQLSLLGGTAVKVGSDNFVLSNYSFQDGTTYYLDTGGNGMRNILQFHHLKGAHSIEVLLHHADRLSEKDTSLFSLPLP